MAKSKCFVRLDKLTCLTYELPIVDNTLYLPSEVTDFVNYKLEIEFKDVAGDILYTDIPETVTAVFLNSRTGGRYSLNCEYVSTLNNLSRYDLTISSQAYEDSSSDILEIVFESLNYLGSLRIPIQIKKIKKTNKVFNYLSSGLKIKDSNLLAKRVKIGFPAWSNVNININSNTLKLLEPLHSIYSSVYSKSNEYLLQSFDLDYEPLIFKRVFLKNYPKVISRVLSNSFIEELKETDDIKSAPKKIEVSPPLTPTVVGLFSYYYDYKRNSELAISNLINQDHLYLKLLDSSKRLFTACYITGYDKGNNILTEVTIIRKDMYVKLQNKFVTVVDIDCNEAIEITNYVDLRYSHYINERPYITPPIADHNLKTFKPEVVIKTNHELTNNIVTLNNNLIEKGNEQYKYNIESTQLKSFYLNDELDVIYLSGLGAQTTLNYSKLNVDYSSEIGDKTCNNNPYIELSDNNTVVGDWCDVIVSVDRLVKETGVKSFYLQIKNKDLVYYYNSDTNSLSQEKVYVYTELLLTDVMGLSIFIDNAEPYIFSIVDEKSGLSFSAMVENYKINPISTNMLENAGNGYLIKQGNTISLIEENSSNVIEFSDLDSKFQKEICIALDYEFANQLDFILNIGDYYIRNNETNLPDDSFCLYINKSKGKILLYLDKVRLKELIGTNIANIKLGTSFNSLSGVLIETLLQATCSVKDYLNNFQTTLLPKILTRDPDQIEYTISFNIDDLQNLTFTRESDYD